jgi:hypothetical protein
MNDAANETARVLRSEHRRQRPVTTLRDVPKTAQILKYGLAVFANCDFFGCP